MTSGGGKKTGASKSTAKKSPAKKTSASTTAATKATTKASPKKASPKKASPKKASAKTAAKKPAAKAPAKKAATKKPGAKAPAKKAATKEAAKAPDTLAVRADESPWTTAELAEVHDLLTLEAARLREEISDAEEGIAEMLRDSADAGGEDQADTGSKTFEREHEMSLAASHREILGQTERALARIADGTYGVCENCGNPIGKARLLAFPRATLCVTCKEREERR